jgi:hypothetical protein
MDANRQRFWMLADETDWFGVGREHVGAEYDRRSRRLRLRDAAPERSLAGSWHESAANGLRGTPARALDAFGTTAFWNPTLNALQVSGGGTPTQPPATLWIAPPGVRVSDLAMGFDDVLYLVLQERDTSDTVMRTFIGLFDPRGRWRRPPIFEFTPADVTPERLAADPGGGAWVLGRGRSGPLLDRPALGHVHGLPLRDGQPPKFSDTTFRPEDENPHAPAFALDPHQPVWAAGEIPVGLACSPAGRIAVIAWRDQQETWLHTRECNGRWQPARRLSKAGSPVSVTWESNERVVILPTARMVGGVSQETTEAIAYDIDDSEESNRDLLPAGDFYPLRGLHEALFVKGVTLPPHYPVAGGLGRSAGLRSLSFVS